MNIRLIKHTPVIIVAIATVLAWTASCKFSKYKRTISRTDTLCVDSATYTRIDSTHGKKITIRIRADYPTPITGKLSANIAAWVRGRLGDGVPADTMDAQKVVDYYGNAKYLKQRTIPSLKKGMYYNADCRMESNRRNYVSFKFTLSECTEGIHGVTSVSAITMRKSDGKPFGWNMLKDTASENFRKIMREGVRTYLKETLNEYDVSNENMRSLMTDESAQDNTEYNPLKHFPTPKTPPYLSQSGMTFVFQPYEITPFSLGAPTFTVPFPEIKEYMTDEALRLLKKRKHKNTDNI